MRIATVTKIEFTQEEMLMAQRVAKGVAWKWSRVDADEVMSELYWWLCNSYKWVTLYREQGDSGRYKLAAAMRRAAHAYCAGEQKERVGGTRKEDTQLYLREEVTNALPFIFDFTDWPQHSSRENADLGRAYDLRDTGNAVAILSDVSAAYYGLSEADRHVISLRFKLDLPYKQVGEYLELSEDAARKRTDRAVDRLLAQLSGGTLSWDVHQRKTGTQL